MVGEVTFLSIYKEKIYGKGLFKMEVPSALTYRIWLDFGIVAREYRHALLHTRGGYMLALEEDYKC
jgi:hypothetical protein